MADVKRKRSSRSVGYYRDLNNLTTASQWEVSERSKVKKREILKEFYTVEELVGSRYNKSLKEREFLVKWKGWGSEFNSWEPKCHILDKKLIRNFDNPKIADCVIESHVEMIRNLVEGGLTQSLQSESTILFDHSVFRHIFSGKGRSLGRDTIAFNANDFPRKYFPEGWDSAYCNKRLVIRKLRYPVHVRPFLGRSRQLFNVDGVKKPRRWIKKLTVSFRKQTV